MRLKTHLILFFAFLLEAGAWAARAKVVAETKSSLPMKIVNSGVCMVTECGFYSLLFVIIPAVAVYFYRTYIRVGF